MESNLIDIKPFEEILCNKEALLESYRHPVRDDRFVYACASSVMIRISVDRVCFTDIPVTDYMINHDSYVVVKEHTLHLSDLRSLYEKIREERQRKVAKEEMELCYECSGSGKVEWEFCGTYRKFERELTCPVCNGKRYIKANREGLPKPGDFASMFDHVFYADSISKLYQLLEELGVSECRVYETIHSILRIPVNESVTIYVVFPIMIQHWKPWVHLTLNETQH